jgi:outer membrane autotransporter protein
MGVDFKKVGKFQSGVAFNYGEGDTNSVGNAVRTHSDYDFWGVGYYGNIRNEDYNFIFDVNYAQSESEVEQNQATKKLEASPETTTWSAGVKLEKLYQNENVQVVPYAGLRFMSVDTDSYKANIAGATVFNYAPERQNIWLLPLGVSIKQEIGNNNGWTVTPKVDLSYIWAFGDTDSDMTVAIPGVSATSRLGYTVMDDESWLGLVGVEAAKGDWTFGVSYSYQKGDYSENEKWYVDAKYSF